MKASSLVLTVLLALVAFLGWIGWANFETRQQANQALAATHAEIQLVSDPTSGTQQILSPLIGMQAPNFTLEDLNGKKVSLAGYKGKVVVLNFWATWCAPCRVETPWLIELRNKYASDNLEVLALSADDIDYGDNGKVEQEKQSIARSAAQLHMPYPVLINATSLSDSYNGLDSLPASFFVNREGKIVAAQIGLGSKDELESKFKLALGK